MAITIPHKCFLFLLLLLPTATLLGIKKHVPEPYAAAGSSSLEQNKKSYVASTRQLLVVTTSDDAIDPPTTPIYNPTPGIITVPSTSPVTVTPGVYVPPTVPITTNPVPVTNPVTTYPAPTGVVPASTPPAMTNGPAISGQSWCVARTGVPQTSLQLGLDYACGNGADCSQIQQAGSCYNPNTLQNHASYAFNSYYQRNPVATSCDFGGTAAIVNTNPSTGACIFSLSASPSTPVTAPATTSTPVTAPSTASTPGAGVTSSTNPPALFNSTYPNSGTISSAGSAVPPNLDSSTSTASSLRPFIILVFIHCYCTIIYSKHVV